MVESYWEWCSTEQKRRYDIFFDYMGYSFPKERSSYEFLCWKWKALVHRLAEDRFVGLRLPMPYQRGRRDEGPKLLDAVANEHAMTAGPIKDSRALRLAKSSSQLLEKKSETNLYRQLQAAKVKHIPAEVRKSLSTPWWRWWLKSRSERISPQSKSE